MENNKRDIKALFNRNYPLEIPRYQREYVWKDEEEAKDLLDDLENTDEQNPLFLGNIILNKSDNQTRIVDGQQRITSILILLIACRVFARSEGFNINMIQGIQGYIVLSDYREKITPILSSNEKLQPVLLAMADLDWDGKYNKDTMGNKWAWNKLSKPYNFFYEEIKKYYPEEKKLEALFRKILGMEFIEITVHDEDEAISTFERVNARGQHLQVYDLLKAYLFSKEDHLEDDVEETWKSIQSHAEKSDMKLKKILHFFYFSKKGYVPPAQLYRKLKNQAEDGQDLEKFVEELKSFAKLCELVASKLGDDSDFEKDMKDFIEKDIGLSGTKIMDEDRIKQVAISLFAIRLFKVSSVYPLLYSSLLSLRRECEKHKNIIDKKEKDEKDKKLVDAWIDMLRFFEHFLFTRNRIAHNTSQQGGSLQKLYSDYCKIFADDEGDFCDNIKKLKSQFTNMIKISEVEFVENFKDLSYSNKDDKLIIYYVFDKLNNTTTEGKTVNPANRHSLLYTEKYLKTEHSIEHLFSQSEKKSIKEDDQYELDSIGNLLVVHRRDNSSLGNKEPKQKMKQIKGWINDGNISNKPYIERFVEKYEKIFEEGRWNLEEIKKRTEAIAKQIYWITAEEKYKDKNKPYSDLR